MIMEESLSKKSQGSGKFERMAQKVWDEMDWDSAPAPQQHQDDINNDDDGNGVQHSRRHHHQAEAMAPNSPMANGSVAAVSLAEESMTTTITHQSATETPARRRSTSPVDASARENTPPAPALCSPLRDVSQPWEEVHQKLVFSDWNFFVDSERGKVYRHAQLPHAMTLQEVQNYAKEHYGWVGERRTTRHSNPSAHRKRNEHLEGCGRIGWNHKGGR